MARRAPPGPPPALPTSRCNESPGPRQCASSEPKTSQHQPLGIRDPGISCPLPGLFRPLPRQSAALDWPGGKAVLTTLPQPTPRFPSCPLPGPTRALPGGQGEAPGSWPCPKGRRVGGLRSLPVLPATQAVKVETVWAAGWVVVSRGPEQGRLPASALQRPTGDTQPCPHRGGAGPEGSAQWPPRPGAVLVTGAQGTTRTGRCPPTLQVEKPGRVLWMTASPRPQGHFAAALGELCGTPH